MGRAKNTISAVAMPVERRAIRQQLDVMPDQEWFQHNPAVILQAHQIARELDYDEIIASRLVMRGLDAQGVVDYLNPGPQHIRTPDDTVDGMTDAAADLSQAIHAGEKVAIYGDYDVDGQTSMAIISQTLTSYGAELYTGSASAVSGFGLSREFVENAHQEGAKWLITVDCGSTQTEPVRLAQSLGMKVIVIDHHDVDLSNSADYHLNPRLRAAHALEQIQQIVQSSPDSRQKHWKITQPYTDCLDSLTQRTVEILKMELGDAYYQELCDDVEKFGHPTNTGSMLTWKFASAFHLQQASPTPAEHWGSPLYLAGLGAIADMAPCDDQEVRAFVRVPTDQKLQKDHFSNRHVIPEGVEMVADILGEDPERPDTLIRTRALLNLPKRTGEIDPEDIQTILCSKDRQKLEEVVPRLVADYERLSAIRRDQMDPIAIKQIEETEARGETGYFNYVKLEGFEEYSGYARMVANNAARRTGRPTLAFTRKGVDQYGQELWKFSGANDCVPEAKLGDLINNPEMVEACTVRMLNWLGEEADIPNLGGHLEVVSGVCTTENIAKVTAACEAWAGLKDQKKKWRPVETKRPRVAKRQVAPARLRRLEREADLLAPLKFPEAPAVQVSVNTKLRHLQQDPETKTWQAIMVLDDGSERQAMLSEEIANLAQARPRTTFEAIIALGKPGPYYISKVAKA